MSSSHTERVRQIAADVFNLPLAQITPETSPQTVEHWDSVQHLNLVLALEQELGLEFLPEEIEQMKNVGAIVTLVDGKGRL